MIRAAGLSVLVATVAQAGLFGQGFSTLGSRPGAVHDLTLVGLAGVPRSSVTATFTWTQMLTVGAAVGLQTGSGRFPAGERWSVHGHLRLGTPSDEPRFILENLFSGALQLEPGVVVLRTGEGPVTGVTVPVTVRGAFNTGVVNAELFFSSGFTWLRALEVPALAGLQLEWVVGRQVSFLLRFEGGLCFGGPTPVSMGALAGGVAWRSTDSTGKQ